jgi:3-phenylpropionate/trans-cinnamate dioxygenase ferredoxin reductase component
MSTTGGIVIVGGGLAAAPFGVHRTGHHRHDEDHLPCDRPPLSKEVLRSETDDVTLKPASFYQANDITVRLGAAAQAVDTAGKTVTLADGTVLAYDELVIAIGLVPGASRRWASRVFAK